MNDPISALQAPPPRYLLESDSSDEEGQGEYAASSSRRPARPESPAVKLQWAAPGQEGVKEVIVGLGQVGRYLSRKTGSGGSKEGAAVRILIGETEVGRGWIMGDCLVIQLEEAEGEEAWKVSEKLVEEIQGAKWTILTAYVPAMYIPDLEQPKKSELDTPIRVLSSPRSKQGEIAAWDSPNYLTGVAAAFASLAAHPASPLDSTSLTTLILPLPISSLNTSNLVSTLSSATPALSSVLAEKSKTASRETRWDEADDEPFSASGMGGGKKYAGRGGAAGLGKEEISSMYM